MKKMQPLPKGITPFAPKPNMGKTMPLSSIPVTFPKATGVPLTIPVPKAKPVLPPGTIAMPTKPLVAPITRNGGKKPVGKNPF